jgi:predicted Zn-dependent peptidase
VYASYFATKNRGSIFSYAGTTASEAQKTLDVLRAELKRLAEGIEPDEFRRAIVGMKSHLVMQGESTGARAAAIAADQYVHGRPRTLEEVEKKVDAITLERVNEFVKDNPAGAMTIVTVGPDELSP